MLSGLKGREEPPLEPGPPSTSFADSSPSLPLPSPLPVPGSWGWDADLPSDARDAELPRLRLDEPRSSSGSSAAGGKAWGWAGGRGGGPGGLCRVKKQSGLKAGSSRTVPLGSTAAHRQGQPAP